MNYFCSNNRGQLIIVKPFVLLLIIVLFVFAVCGCQGSSNDSEAAGSSTSKSKAAVKSKVRNKEKKKSNSDYSMENTKFGQERNTGGVSTDETYTTVSKPSAPELAANLLPDSKVELTWQSMPGTDYYEVYRYDEAKMKWKGMVRTKSLSWTDDHVTDRQTYEYRVCAVKKKTDSVVRSDFAEAKIRTIFTVKALIVDKETKSSKRMVKYLKNAGFEVDREESLDSFNVEDYDTLVIPGGHNITPDIYGAERDKHTYGTNEEIDRLQIGAIQEFQKEEKPVLGVCRGCQVVNVALGGTINQHIPGWHKKYRTVTIDKKSWLYPKIGAAESVYHSHHQCVEELGEGLIATQWDEEDGRIEAIEHESLPIYGIQWHPDSMGDRGVEVFTWYKELVQEYISKMEY